MLNMDNRDNNLFHNRVVPTGQDFEPIGDIDPMMGWRGLQALQGHGTIADMFTGVDRQFGLFGAGAGGMERGQNLEPRHPAAPGFPAALPVSGFNNFTVAMAQAQQAENMMRLQQLQQQNPDFVNKHQPQSHHQFPAVSGHPLPEMTRHFPGLPPPQCQSPSPNGFSLPPGPRPRPVGGDSSPPGFSTDAIPTNMNDDLGHHLQQQAPGKNNVEPQLVIGSWNDECDKDDVVSSLPSLSAPPPSVPHNMSQPPPRLVGADQEWGGTFQMPRGGGHAWAGVDEFHTNDFGKKPEKENKFDPSRQDHQPGGNFRGKRGGRGGGGQRGRGGYQPRPGMDHSKEKVQGKNAAIEETKAMLAKMRLEDQELMSKNKKGNTNPDVEKPVIQPGAYRPRDNRRGRGGGNHEGQERGGRGGRGRGGGRGGVNFNQHQPPMMRMPFIPGDFRTPPFPGMDGPFLPPAGFPPHLAPGFPPGLFPLGMEAMRGGRGGFNRGRGGFPIGFPPRGFPPPMIGYRGRGRGRGRGGHNPGNQRNEEFIKKDPVSNENPENPMLSAIYSQDETENKEEKVEKEEDPNPEENQETENSS